MCKYCKGLNEEKEPMTVDTIELHPSGFYNYHIPIIHCPACGKVLNKYNGIDKKVLKEQIENGIY